MKNVENYDSLKKQDLVYKILDHQALNPEIDFKELGIEMPALEKVVKEKPQRKSAEKPERAERAEKAEKPEKAEKTERKEQVAVIEKAESTSEANKPKRQRIIPDSAGENGADAAKYMPHSYGEKTEVKKIIKDGSISIKVNDVEISKRRMDTVIKAFGAYYEQEEFENYENRSSYNLKIRIPSKQFEKFLKTTEDGTGELISKNINARDVTEEYTDSEIRLESKKLFSYV